MAYTRKREPKVDKGPSTKGTDPTVGTIRKRNVHNLGDRGSYFWRNRCTSCAERLKKRQFALASKVDDAPRLIEL